MSRGSMVRRGIRCAALAACVGLAGCATNPATGKKEFSLVSQSQEIQMGKEGHEAILKEYGVYNDPRLQAYVDSIGQALARVSHSPNLDWHFTLLDDATVNAFALPGGYIYVTRGIMVHLASEAQLAGVIGHEIGHVTARHSAQRMTQQQIAGLGLGMASIFSSGFRRYSDVAQQALGLVFLKYGRDHENQSDQLGVDYATAAGYDPREIPATYQTLGRVGEKAGQRMPAFMSTHPDPGDRQQRTTALAAKAAAGKTNLIVRGKAYLQGLDGVVFGADPRHGYFKGGTFYHPELRVQITFPSGWQAQNSSSAVIAAEPNQRAMMQLTIVNPQGLTPEAYVRQLEQNQRIAGSRGNIETIGGFPAWVGRVAVANQDGTQSVIAAVLIQATKERMYQILGKSTEPGDADEGKIVASARTFRAVTDEARISVQADRLRVVPAKAAGTFEAVVGRLGPLAVELQDLVILNNLDPEENVLAGQLVKVVEPGRR